jgi:hypothetical protein
VLIANSAVLDRRRTMSRGEISFQGAMPLSSGR